MDWYENTIPTSVLLDLLGVEAELLAGHIGGNQVIRQLIEQLADEPAGHAHRRLHLLKARRQEFILVCEVLVWWIDR